MIIDQVRLPTLFKVLSSGDELTKLDKNSPQFIAYIHGKFLGQPTAKQTVMRCLVLDFMQTVYNGMNIPHRGYTNRIRWDRGLTQIQEEELYRSDINIITVRAGLPARMYGSVVQDNVSLASMIAMATVVQTLVETLEHPMFDTHNGMSPPELRSRVGACIQHTLSVLRSYRIVSTHSPYDGYSFSEQNEEQFILRIGTLFVKFEFDGAHVRIVYDEKAREIIKANYGPEHVYD